MLFGLVTSEKKDAGLFKATQIAQGLLVLGAEVACELRAGAILCAHGVHALTDEMLASECDVIISVGGDGTFLRGAHIACLSDIPIIGVNLGKVGYLTELEPDESHMLRGLISGAFKTEKRMMLTAEVLRNSAVTASFLGLNEAVVQNGMIARMLSFVVKCDNKKVASYSADGILISTPTGSTAYSLAAGGPVIDPTLRCLLMQPICPHSLRARAVLFSDESTLTVEIPEIEGRDAYLSVDGRNAFSLTAMDTVVVKKAKQAVKVIKIKDRSFVEILNKKLI